MKKEGKPVPKNIEKMEAMAKAFSGEGAMPKLDFDNTEIAFAHLSDKELKKAAWLFGLMNKHWLVGIGSKLGIAAIRLHLPFVESIVKNTIYEQFCGGTTLLECQPTINRLKERNTFTILDYGAEGKTTEEDFNLTMNETIRAIEFASQNDAIPVVSTKITGLARNELLEIMGKGVALTDKQRQEYQYVLKRLDAICHVARDRKVGVFFDAEESWYQDAIDYLVNSMMSRYNQENVVVYNTFQMYRSDRLKYLRESYEVAKRTGYKLGAKLVRGAYMEKERDRAADQSYPSPILPDKQAVDAAFNEGIRFCVEYYKDIASCNASHNQESAMLQAELIAKNNIPKAHPHLNFCQLYGMSDNLTFNLAAAGYNVAKYVPYGPVRDVVPYLIRRAQENSSVTGDMGREYALVHEEMKRRGLA
ncbi:proline dehydrogenase family protein [Flavilitoribacter nigricans]|uniref:Proline dehydrogenase n=1 Tax=Flavilitoribacter nigricans (strain ATCC 23147 / DSM 23189 / NBRC 102662 / NCIMB 1420 / SS-2) TaxID=1122177 RepID=A0A2D0NDA0_FLAN2|nr:proline dehydrogenase family protein [Flavilitoribacter nigricans]PHN06346.1 proline dehydrogenase [Flavilitoribacter nigricans DSM 23189 = NBRC 102662]